MRRLFSAALLAVALIVGLGTAPAMAAKDPVKVTKAIAADFGCKYPDVTRQSGGGKNKGVNCVVNSDRAGRQEFYVGLYENEARALDYWKDWTSSNGFFAKKGNVFIMPFGAADSDPYTRKWAKYASNRVDGSRVVASY